MSAYLARFFLHPKTGKQQRHLMLANGSWVLGEWIGPNTSMDTSTPEAKEALLAAISSGDLLEAMSNARFFEENFDAADNCVIAFEQLGADAVAAGFFETDLVDRMLDIIPDDAVRKPAWQQAVDRYYLRSVVADSAVRPPSHREVQSEPLLLYLTALQRLRRDAKLADQALSIAMTARDEIDRHKAHNVGMYCWSLAPENIEAGVYEAMFLCHESLGDKDGMLAAIRRAVELGLHRLSHEHLAWVQCWHFPQYREDAFEQTFRYEQFGYESIKKHPDYAAYAKRRAVQVASCEPIWRWCDMQAPMSDAQISAAEVALGVTLPADYRIFLAQRGQSQVSLHLGEQSQHLQFAGTDLPLWSSAFQDWLDIMGAAREGFTDDWSQRFGVDRRALHSVATPWDNSSCLVINLSEGADHGACYLWDHDEAYELVPIARSFDQALKALQDGFASGDATIRAFLKFD